MMHNPSTFSRSNIYSPTFNIFIIIHETVDIAEMKQSGLLIFWWRNHPATSYVAAMFHPTIGQCAHQSLSITAIPEMGMIPQGTRDITGSHIAQNQNIYSQANTSLGFTDCPAKPIRNWVLQVAKETNQQRMGSLDLSSQATLASNTQSTHLIKHSHTQLLDMNKTFLGTKMEMATGENNPTWGNTFSGNVLWLHRGKNDLIKPSDCGSILPSARNYQKRDLQLQPTQ